MKELFTELNYTFGNEDSTIEYEMLPHKVNSVAVVAGSGSRVIPLLAKNPKRITCIDTSKSQTAITELRVETLRNLEYIEYLSFWGYVDYELKKSERKEIFYKLNISEDSKEIIEKIFIENDWEPILYAGKWEKTFRKISMILKKIIRNDGLDIFMCENIDEQKEYLQSQFPKNRWKLAVMLLGNATMFNTLMYKGKFPKKNISESYYKYYSNRLNKILNKSFVKDNFFLQILFFGKLKYEQGLPIEVKEEIFQRAKEALHNTQIIYLNKNILELDHKFEKYDFLSLSDIVSYLNPEIENNYLQILKDHINKNGVIVSRYYLRSPKSVDQEGFADITEKYSDLFNGDKMQMYDFGVFKKL